jgi:hypothetical protein
MALTDENGGGMVMPVQPLGNGYGGGNGGFGNCFGGDGWWVLLLFLLIGGNGFGFGGYGGGIGAMAADGAMLYPWINQSQQVNDGFRDQMISGNINSIRDGIGNLATQICGATGDIQNTLCSGFAGTNATINNGFANAETAANARQIANMQQAFNAQSAVTAGMNDIAMGLQNCCCENRASIADLKYTVATENCADRAALSDGLKDLTMSNYTNSQAILNAINNGIQSIKDDLCADRLEAERRENQNLRSELMYARGQASQVEQTAQLRAAQATTANQLVAELRSCPIPAQPVYGNQPIFTCPQNNMSGCGCGCGA